MNDHLMSIANQQLVTIARTTAYHCDEQHEYMKGAGGNDWLPHKWVVEAMRAAVSIRNTQAEDAVREELHKARAQLAELQEAFTESQEEVVSRGKMLAEAQALLARTCKLVDDQDYVDSAAWSDLADEIKSLTVSAEPFDLERFVMRHMPKIIKADDGRVWAETSRGLYVLAETPSGDDDSGPLISAEPSAPECLTCKGSGLEYDSGAAHPCTDCSLPSAPTPMPAYMEAACDKFDWAPEEALRFYAEGKHFDNDNGRTRILCTGAIASHALKGMSKEYADLKGSEQGDPSAPVEIDEPACDRCQDKGRFSVLGRCPKCGARGECSVTNEARAAMERKS